MAERTRVVISTECALVKEDGVSHAPDQPVYSNPNIPSVVSDFERTVPRRGKNRVSFLPSQ